MRFTVETEGRTAVHDLTNRVTAVLPPSAAGVATVFVRHTTAGVVVNEAEERLLSDVETFVDDHVPDGGWEHDQIDDNSVARSVTGSAVQPQNADSHLRALLLGESVTVPVADGELDLGTWQSVLLVECDGPRTREVDVIVH